MEWGRVATDWGVFHAIWDGRGLKRLLFPGAPPPPGRPRRSPLLERLSAELTDYLAGRRRDFTVRIAPVGTPFQLGVWEELVRIPYGEVISYGELAARLGRPRAARAVGNAVGANPIPILIPCHRVIRATGELGGFGPGIGWKRRLLELEGAMKKLAAPVGRPADIRKA